jgi:hypothetical protein
MKKNAGIILVIALALIGLVLYTSGVFANPYVEKPLKDDTTGEVMGSLGYQIWLVYADGSKENLVVTEQTQSVIRRSNMQQIYSIEFQLNAKGDPQMGQTAAVIDWTQSTFAVTSNVHKYASDPRTISLMTNGQPVPSKVLNKNYPSVSTWTDIPLDSSWHPIYGWGMSVQGNIASCMVPGEGLQYNLINAADHIFRFDLSGTIKYRGAGQDTFNTYTASGNFEFSVDVSAGLINLDFEAPWNTS